MYGKVKRLRAAGKRLSDHDIARAQHVEGEVTLAGLGNTLVLTVTNPNSQVGESLFPMLYEARLTTMHGTKMLFKGEERPQGDAGPAYVQEWSIVIGV
ncbi:hypothetical protein [Massilia varians]|uniref:hypothetical protein n=1 Tax=Massilia varians TaxID=457921 RepID=UPI0025572AAA|nr:hypothetical protein [Massilia varians]MDK6077952.1 hypothetical protein [Massilia varians]